MRRYLFPLLLVASAMAQQNVSYSNLKEGQPISGFRATAAYLDDSDHAIGARFRHERTGFTLDLLQIQSVPQAFIWVTTLPDFEHGRAAYAGASAAGQRQQGPSAGQPGDRCRWPSPTAFTDAVDAPAISFYTSAGPDVFLQPFRPHHGRAAAIRITRMKRFAARCAISASVKIPRPARCSLEEKGTVYNEMVTSMDQAPNALVSRAAGFRLYGPGASACRINSGGTAGAICA